MASYQRFAIVPTERDCFELVLNDLRNQRMTQVCGSNRMASTALIIGIGFSIRGQVTVGNDYSPKGTRLTFVSDNVITLTTHVYDVWTSGFVRDVDDVGRLRLPCDQVRLLPDIRINVSSSTFVISPAKAMYRGTVENPNDYEVCTVRVVSGEHESKLGAPFFESYAVAFDGSTARICKANF